MIDAGLIIDIPWVLSNVVKFDTPIPYVHKAGCVGFHLMNNQKKELKKWS